MGLTKFKKLYFIWAFIMILIIGLLTTYGVIYKTKLKTYLDLENKIVIAGKEYFELSSNYLKNGEEFRLNLEEIKEKNIMESLNTEKEECDGYVLIKNENGTYHYKGYVKCPNYQTKNYKDSNK